MMAGYAFGKVFEREEALRIKMIFRLGLALTILFVILWGVNVYGDPAPWKYFESTTSTFLSFFNTTKYPPSLLFLLMTLGPALVLIALTDRMNGAPIWQRVVITFGRVPMFYYILQWFYAHGAAVTRGYLAGVDVTYLFINFPANSEAAPPGHGFPLAVTYAVWIVGLIVLYPLCAWWADLKRRNKHWLLSYL